MNPIWFLAKNTFRQSLQARSLFLVLSFGVALVFFMILASHGDETFRQKMVLDAGMTLLKVFGTFLVIFNTLPLFPGERNHHTLHAILAMNISRSQLVYGLFSGAILALILNFVLMLVIFCIAAAGMGILLSADMLRSMIFLFEELSVLTAFSVFFSIGSTFLIGLMLCFFILVVGNMTYSLQLIIHETQGVPAKIISALYYLLPNFALFDLKDAAINSQAIPYSYDLAALLYSVSLCVIMLCLSSWLLERQEIS